MMCSKKFYVVLALVLVSASLSALPLRFVGDDSTAAKAVRLEVQVLELQAEIELKESEIASLRESLSMYREDSEGLLTDSTKLLTQVNELKEQLSKARSELTIAKEELESLRSQLGESQSELSASAPLLETATEIVATESSLWGGFFGAGALYDFDSELAVEVYAGLSYGMLGIYAGVQSDVAPDMYLPEKFTYKAGLQINF